MAEKTQCLKRQQKALPVSKSLKKQIESQTLAMLGQVKTLTAFRRQGKFE